MTKLKYSVSHSGYQDFTVSLKAFGGVLTLYLIIKSTFRIFPKQTNKKILPEDDFEVATTTQKNSSIVTLKMPSPFFSFLFQKLKVTL